MFEEFDLFYHFLLLIFIAFLIVGWHIVTRLGMLMDFFGKAFMYSESEELLKQLPNLTRQQKLTTVMLFEGGLNDIKINGGSIEMKLQLLREFEDYLNSINEDNDKETEKLLAALEASKKSKFSRWKKFIGKPLGNCVACSASFFGITSMGFAYYPMLTSGNYSVPVILFLVLSLPVISGMAVMIENILSREV